MECKACGTWFVSGQNDGVCLSCKTRLKKMGLDIPYDRLKELVEADRDGRAIISPVKLYHTVLFARNPDREPDNVVETTVQKIICKNNGGVYMKLSCNAMYETSCNSIGKTVFLTPEAAKAALKEGQK